MWLAWSHCCASGVKLQIHTGVTLRVLHTLKAAAGSVCFVLLQEPNGFVSAAAGCLSASHSADSHTATGSRNINGKKEIKPCNEVTCSQELHHCIQWGHSAREIWDLYLRVLVAGFHAWFGFGWRDKLVLCCTGFCQSLVVNAYQNYWELVLIALNCVF